MELEPDPWAVDSGSDCDIAVADPWAVNSGSEPEGDLPPIPADFAEPPPKRRRGRPPSLLQRPPPAQARAKAKAEAAARSAEQDTLAIVPAGRKPPCTFDSLKSLARPIGVGILRSLASVVAGATPGTQNKTLAKIIEYVSGPVPRGSSPLWAEARLSCREASRFPTGGVREPCFVHPARIRVRTVCL
jgi:hypothetical protein